jgi:hypothetical protein
VFLLTLPLQVDQRCGLRFHSWTTLNRLSRARTQLRPGLRESVALWISLVMTTAAIKAYLRIEDCSSKFEPNTLFCCKDVYVILRVLECLGRLD